MFCRECISCMIDIMPHNQLHWWEKDRYGYPIETIKGRPIFAIIRIIFQNIRKFTG